MSPSKPLGFPLRLLYHNIDLLKIKSPFWEIMYKMYKSMVYYYSMPKYALL